MSKRRLTPEELFNGTFIGEEGTASESQVVALDDSAMVPPIDIDEFGRFYVDPNAPMSPAVREEAERIVNLRNQELDEEEAAARGQ